MDCACGDGACAPSLEDATTRAADCRCGDGVCHLTDETRASCSDDCGPTFDQLDWLVQDRVIADPTLDPYCVPNGERVEQDSFTPIHFALVDQEGQQNFTSFRVRAFHDQTRWTDPAHNTFDFPPYFETQRATDGTQTGWGDTCENEGPLVSFAGTNDGGGAAGWYNNTGAHGCSYSDAWVLYDETDVPLSPGDRVLTWSDELRTAIRGVRDPSTRNCPPVGGGISRTRWTLYPDFAFAAPSACRAQPHKLMHTIVADHAPNDLSHHEVFYLTDEYGMTRWERWNCSTTRQLEAPSPDYAAMRCNYAESESVMHMAYPVPEAPDQGWQILNRAGMYCVLYDCRDGTEVTPWTDPAGWLPAAWAPGAQVFFVGNLLHDGDFSWSDPGPLTDGWTRQGTMRATTALDAAGNHRAVLQTEGGPGWFSQTADLTEFRETLGAGASAAGATRVRFGVRARTATGARRIQIAIVQWDAAHTTAFDTSVQYFDLNDRTQHLIGEVPLLAEARRVQIRINLPDDTGPDTWVDDAFVLISDAP